MRSTIQVPGGASAYGISVAALQEFSQTAGFYADLSRSGVILREVAAQTYATSESKGAKRPLPEILGIKEKNYNSGGPDQSEITGVKIRCSKLYTL